MTTQSAGWQRMVTAERNWKMLARALRPYLEEMNAPGLPMRARYYLERIDEKHRYGQELEQARRVWLENASDNTPFFEWLSDNEREIITEAQDGVVYMDATQRRRFEVQITGGRIVSSHDEELRAALAEFDSDQLIFVVDLDGRLYALPKVKYDLHHSSFLSGGKVRMAGTFQVDDKLAICAVTNASGHYAVGETDVEAFLPWLAERGVRLHGIKLDLVSADGNAINTYPAGVWLHQRRAARLREERRRGNAI
jgi:hypothetical protein